MLFIKSLINLLLIFFSVALIGQDIIVRTNGAQINVKVIEISEDSIWFKNKNMYGSPLMGLPKTEVKFIEYWNGKKDYFHGSYVNLSIKDTSSIVTGFNAENHTLLIEYILFTVENLFTENHLVMDYSNHWDSMLSVAKGKMEFIFENERDNFFVKFFPINTKAVFTKFEFIDGAVNKRYDRLTSRKLTSLIIYMNDSVHAMALTDEQSIGLKELFLSKDF